MPTVTQIIEWVEKQAGHRLHSDEGVTFGDTHRSIRRAAVCWTASPAHIAVAADSGAELLIHHESLCQPYPMDNRQAVADLRWPTNHQRLRLLSQHNLVALRIHGTIDELTIYNDFAAMLGLNNVVARGEHYHERVFEIPPTPLPTLIDQVKRTTGLPAVRATSINPQRLVRYVGMPWGGLGLFVNVGYQQKLLDLWPQIDVMIMGETDNYGFRFATELGIDVIETSHEVSEDAGLARFASQMSGAFENFTVQFLPTPCVWAMQ